MSILREQIRLYTIIAHFNLSLHHRNIFFRFPPSQQRSECLPDVGAKERTFFSNIVTNICTLFLDGRRAERICNTVWPGRPGIGHSRAFPTVTRKNQKSIRSHVRSGEISFALPLGGLSPPPLPLTLIESELRGIRANVGAPQWPRIYTN